MTVTLFLTLFVIGATISSLLTEVVKKMYQNAQKSCAPNLIAGVNGVCVGLVGTTIMYLFLDIPFTINNIICIILMGICIWGGSMVGYDKFIQLINQINATGVK